MRGPVAAGELLPFEQWGALKKTPAPDLEVARVYHHWARGRELTEKQFDAALAEAANLVFR